MTGLTGAVAASLSSMATTSKQTETISANISNTDTNGYKAFSVVAHSVVISGNSGTSPGGVTSSTNVLVDVQGSMTRTEIATDLALDGSGFFVVRDPQNEDIFVSKTSAFRKNSEGDFVDAFGREMMAWELDTNGRLPQTKSLVTSLEPVNVKELISEASATTTVDIAATLKADEYAAGNTTFLINITNTGIVGSPHNYDINSTDIMVPNTRMNIGGGIRLKVGGEVTEFLYGGILSSQSYDPLGTDLVGIPTDAFNCNINGSDTIDFKRGSGTNNLEVLEFIAKQINITKNNQYGATARVVTDGITGAATLYIAPADANYSMSFSGTLKSELGMDDKAISEFIASEGSYTAGRFATLKDLSSRFEKDVGLKVKIFDEEGVGSVVTVTSEDDITISNIKGDSNNASDFLSEFGIPAGYIESVYNPYDQSHNLASRKSDVDQHFSRDFKIYDALGNGHDFMVSFVKLNANKWGVEIFSIDPTQIIGRSDGLVAAGYMTFTDEGRLESIQNSIQRVNSISIPDPSADLAGTYGQTFEINVKGDVHAFTYADTIARSQTSYNGGLDGIEAAGNDFITGSSKAISIPAADVLDIEIAGVIYSLPVGTYANTAVNNLDFLTMVANDISASIIGGLVSVEVEQDDVLNLVNLRIKPLDRRDAITFTDNVGTSKTNLGLVDIPERSFKTMLDLAEQINATTGVTALEADIIPTNNREYSLIISPTEHNYMSFSGSLGAIGSPLGSGTSTTFASAFGFKRHNYW